MQQRQTVFQMSVIVERLPPLLIKVDLAAFIYSDQEVPDLPKSIDL